MLLGWVEGISAGDNDVMPSPVSNPVTTSVTRHVDPSRTSEMLAWVQAGTSLAERFDGFLGSGWVRPSEESPEWHMLYRFASVDALAAWEASPQRAWWLEAAQGRIEATRVERRTGIEGWFDQPVTAQATSAEASPAPMAPPRWKQMVTIFVVFFPLSLAANFLLGRTPIAHWALPLRVLLTVMVMTPLMTYVLLPWITRKMAWWLHR